jgi:hypothetical protein
MRERRDRDAETGFGDGALVTLAPDVAGVPTPDGGFAAPERLGPGLVRARGRDDVLVHWVDADLDTWVPRGDVEPLGPGQRLLTVWRCDQRGRRTLLRRAPARLEHHWRVDVLPTEVVRAVREDGLCWTFAFNTLTREVEPHWGEELDDDAAEAIVAADLATRPPPALRRPFWRFWAS